MNHNPFSIHITLSLVSICHYENSYNMIEEENEKSFSLSALFKKETGKPLTEYVTRKRVEHAAYLLRSTSMQVQTVAQQCGILDVNYFAKMFKRYTGKTPKEYREGI